MIEKHIYLIPDYYPEFSCKMGACRASCCDGWPVSLSLDDYYKLVGLDCDPALRARLDCAIHPKLDPFPEDYAELTHRYDGRCHLRMDDGRCALHAALGEDALPFICRLYPRAVRGEGDYECSCANSCERVVELLLHRREPLRFIERELTFDLPKQTASSVYRETFPEEQARRMALIGIMQDRSLSLPRRFLRLSAVMGGIDAPTEVTHEDIVAHLPVGLTIIDELIDALDRRSVSLRDYGEAVRAHSRQGGTLAENYRSARTRFEAAFPHWSEGFENLLVNHMFFTRFPFADSGEDMADECAALSALYGLMRVLSIGWMATHDGEEALVDLLAAIFRLADHSDFHRYTAGILRRNGATTPERFAALVHI